MVNVCILLSVTFEYRILTNQLASSTGHKKSPSVEIKLDKKKSSIKLFSGTGKTKKDDEDKDKDKKGKEKRDKDKKGKDKASTPKSSASPRDDKKKDPKEKKSKEKAPKKHTKGGDKASNGNITTRSIVFED